MTVKIASSKSTACKLPPKILSDADRKVTDKKYSLIFCVILVVWLTSCFYARYYASNTESDKKGSINEVDELRAINNIANRAIENPLTWIQDMFTFYIADYFNFDLHYKEMGSVFIWSSIVFYAALLILGMFLMKLVATLNPAGLVMMSSILMITSTAYHAVRYFSIDETVLGQASQKFVYWLGPEAVLFVISFLALLIVTYADGASTMGNELKKTFKYYFTCRYLIIIGFLICSAIVMLNIFTGEMLKYFSMNDIKSKIIYWIIYSGSVYMIVLTHIMGRIIISATAASYYWNQNQIKSPFKIMCQNMVSIFKYQFGTGCHKATFTSLWFIALLGLIGHKFTDYQIAKYCMIFDFLLLLAFDYTIFFIGMYGLRASEASKQLSRCFDRASTWIIFTCQNFWSSTFYILMPTNCMILMLMWGLNEHDSFFATLSYRSYSEILILMLPSIYVMGTIEDARSICIMDEQAEKQAESKEKSLEKPTEVIATNEKEPMSSEEPTQIVVVADSNNKKTSELEK